MATAEQIAKRLTYDPVFAIGENVRDMMASHIAHAIKQERDACAVIADGWIGVSEGGRAIAQGIANDIRARNK